MLAGACVRVGTIIRRGLATRSGTVPTHSYSTTPAEMEKARLAANNVWLLSQFTKMQSSSMKELATLRAESDMMAKEFNDAVGKCRNEINEATRLARETIWKGLVATGSFWLIACYLVIEAERSGRA